MLIFRGVLEMVAQINTLSILCCGSSLVDAPKISRKAIPNCNFDDSLSTVTLCHSGAHITCLNHDSIIPFSTYIQIYFISHTYYIYISLYHTYIMNISYIYIFISNQIHITFLASNSQELLPPSRQIKAGEGHRFPWSSVNHNDFH